jgi:hypothetical protein
MSVHNWNQPGSARCRRCGATRTLVLGQPKHPLTGHGDQTQENRSKTIPPFDYRLGDGLGTLDRRPACGKGTESRHSRRAGRRAKVLARSRAGSPRLKSKEALALLARLFATAPASATPDVSTPEAPEAS